MTQIHMETLPIPLIKSNHDNKSDKYFVKLKLRSDMTSSLSELYEFKMDLFDNGELKYFVLFVQNFNMTLVASGTLTTGVKFNIFIF